MGETLKESLAATTGLVNYFPNLPRDVLVRYIAERNPDIMLYLSPGDANAARSASYLTSPLGDLKALPTAVLDRYIASRNPDVVNYLTSKEWSAYYGRHPELEPKPFTAQEIAGIPASIQSRYAAEGNPNYLSWYYSQPRENYAGVDFAAESVFYRTDSTGRLFGEHIPWTAENGYWAPPNRNPYPVGSKDWAAYQQEIGRVAGKYTATPYSQERSIIKTGGTLANDVRAAFETRGMSPQLADYMEGMLQGHAYVRPSHPLPGFGGGGPGRRTSTWVPYTLAEDQSYFQSVEVSRNYLYYPSTFDWANRLGYGANFPKSAQGRYGVWWGGYYNQGQTPWEMEKGAYAVTADAPNIEDMSDSVAASMIGDEVMWLGENGDLSSVIGAEFYGMEREQVDM